MYVNVVRQYDRLPERHGLPVGKWEPVAFEAVMLMNGP
ncbi:hypothetical protein STENM223S_04594 [Streptomyces tendae]